MSDGSTRAVKIEFPDYRPFSSEQLADPHAAFARARKEAPVFYSSELRMWILTKYQDVRYVYEHPEIFSSSAVLASRSGIPDVVAKEFGGWTPHMDKQVVMSDPPLHTRLKRLMMKAFTPARVAQFEPWIHQIANCLIDAFHDDGSADLVENYSALIPTEVIGRVLGAPSADSRKFRKWVGAINLLVGTWDVSEEEQINAWRAIREFEEYSHQLVAERRSNPQQDVVSYLIEATSEDGSPALSDEEVVQNVSNIAGAGADTTGNLIASTVYLLLREPSRRLAVERDPSLIAPAIEESLRFASVVRGLVRRVTRSIEIRGVKIHEGELVYIALISANRDDEMFANPHSFEIGRSGVRNHLGLGMGAHTCLGASLARLEARIAIETLFKRLPGLRLASGQTSLQFKKNNFIPGIKELHAKWGSSELG